MLQKLKIKAEQLNSIAQPHYDNNYSFINNQNRLLHHLHRIQLRNHRQCQQYMIRLNLRLCQ